MTDEVITHGGVDRGFKLCKCTGCGEVSLCTPSNDFYTRTEDGLEGPLYCERCTLENRGVLTGVDFVLQKVGINEDG